MTMSLPVPDVDTSQASSLRAYPHEVGRALAVVFMAPGPNEDPSWLMLWQNGREDRDPDDNPVGAYERVFAVCLVVQPSGRDRADMVLDSFAGGLTWREAREDFAARVLA